MKQTITPRAAVMFTPPPVTQEQIEESREKLIRIQKEYIEFLCEDLRRNAAFLAIHGVHCSVDIIEKGFELRAKIKILEEKPDTIKTENGVIQDNEDPRSVLSIRAVENGLEYIGETLVQYQIPNGDSIYEDDDCKYLTVPEPYGDVDKKNVPIGSYYVIFSDKKVLIYTPTEFEANNGVKH